MSPYKIKYRVYVSGACEKKTRLVVNSYERHEQAVGQHLYLYCSNREIFGKQVKRRLFTKWHHRYMRERDREIKRLGEHFGRVVYTYYFQQDGENKVAFTCRPRCRYSRPVTLDYAKAGSR